jgi:hypothetical protein
VVTITCLCGHTADCSAFIDPKKVDRWLRCLACGIKFSSPRNVREIGVQVVRGSVRTEIIPEPITALDRAELELKLWARDKAIKAIEEKEAVRFKQLPLWKQELELIRRERSFRPPTRKESRRRWLRGET